MKTLFITILSFSLVITSYDRTQDTRISALEKNQVLLITQVKALQDSLNAFKAGIVKSNTIVAYPPIYVKDSTDVIKVFYIKP